MTMSPREGAPAIFSGASRRRRHLVTAAAGLGMGIALVVGSMSTTATSSATPPAMPGVTPGLDTVGTSEAATVSRWEELYDSWSQDARSQPASTDASRPPRSAQESERDRQSVAEDTIVVTGEEPMGLSIPAMGASAQVIPVGLDQGGGVFVPEDVRTLGWYTASMPVAAQSGSSVIVGHRDSAVQGAGTFSGIENLQPGEVIEVATASGGTQIYTVAEVRMVDKDQFHTIANEAFTMEGEHRLTLITCGGAFDAAARSYLSNVFVIATPGTA